jgi:hemerythrin-like domain-containing protein
MKCTDLLMQDHKMILRSLDVLQEMARRVESGEQMNINDVRKLLHFLHAFADELHHMKEESALFPELMRTSEPQGAPLRHMLFEHDQERSLVGGLEDALRTKKSMEFVLFATRLASRMRNHIQKEDSILFPIAEALLSKDQDQKVAAEFAKYETDPGLIADLGRLESIYVKRSAAAAQ